MNDSVKLVDAPAAETSDTTPPEVNRRAAELLALHQHEIYTQTDRIFIRLLLAQFVAGIFLALYLTPFTWNGTTREIHPHVWQALFMGLAILISPMVCVRMFPGSTLTRHVIAVSQMLSSALFIHLGLGRIEMHFHVFGSLAFLAFYRDWKVLITASLVVAADHLLRGLFLPMSVFGVATASNWRWLEHAGWVVFEDIILLAACARGRSEMQQIAARQAQLENSYRSVEEKVKQRTTQLESLQQDMVKVARSAGMAEIATSVLHNVGNVLNSVNVSLRVATAKVEQSAAGNLGKVSALLDEHQADLGEFLTQDARGKQVPEYLRMMSEAMAGEQTALLTEMASLTKNVDHIKEIVHLQQTHAKGAGVLEDCALPELLRDAIRVTLTHGAAATIHVHTEYDEITGLKSDKHLLLQILINLLSNAKYAVMNSGKPDRELWLRIKAISREDRPFVRVQIIDNGMGIDPAHLTRIFSHGFTTKKEGHGFGLHSAANTARQLGGTLAVKSDGPGTGAAFSLDLPLVGDAACI